MDKQQLKQRVWDAIDRRADEIIAFGRDVFQHPELGYKEHRTAAKVADKFRALGLDFQEGLAITGLKAGLKGKSAGPSVCVLGELDSVLCPGHPDADPLTGAAHSCVHNGQLAMMLGVGMGLVDAGAAAHFGGDAVLIAVPAEEYVEIEYRARLRREGKISFLGGKQEYILKGLMDDIDITLMIHAMFEEGRGGQPQPQPKMGVGGTSNGFVGKFVKFTGREAHSGAAPHEGINALNAAMLGLFGIHAQRETLRDDDTVRIHPIITKGGDLVNIVPADVRVELYVRGKRMEAIINAAAKVDRALQAGAMAVGAEVDIETLPGYLPKVSSPGLDALNRANAEAIVGKDEVGDRGHTTASGDLGDVSHLMPVATLSVGGVKGQGHSENVRIADENLSYVASAKVVAATVVDLLWDDAGQARKVIADYRPVYNKKSYLKMWEDLLR
ncbi:MAG: amidohydrolase [Bacillota bacterium]|nr:amidohydrolase [Bacillota bacterium]